MNKFESFKRQGRKIGAILALGSALASNAEAQTVNVGKQTKEPTEQSISSKETVSEKEKGRSLEFLDELMRVEAQESIKDKFAAAIDKKDTAMSLLGAFSLEIKSGFQEGSVTLRGRIGPSERTAAVRVLNKYLDEFIDAKFGNGDKKVDPTEMTKFRNSLKDYPGLEMIFQELQRLKLR